MNAYRPTNLRLGLRHCLLAITHAENGVEQNVQLFEAGNAAHEVLYAHAMGIDVDELCRVLMKDGKQGVDGTNPMNADAVIDGRFLADRWNETHGIPDNSTFEERFAFDANWVRLDWPDDVLDANEIPGCRFYTRLDVLSDEERLDEGEMLSIKADRDYKTAWPADASYLNGLQMHLQAVAIWKAFPDIDGIRLEIANLRTMEIHPRELWLADERDLASLEKWQRDVEIAMDAFDPVFEDCPTCAGGRHVDYFTDPRSCETCGGKQVGQLPRKASPGPRCHGCPYIRRCDAAREYVNERHDDLFGRYAVIEAMRAEILPDVKIAVAHASYFIDAGTDPSGEPVTYRIGRISQSRKRAAVGAHAKAFRAFTMEHMAVDESLRNIIESAFGQDDTVGRRSLAGIKLIAQAMYPDRGMKAAREEYIDSLCERFEVPVMKCERVRPPKPDEDPPDLDADELTFSQGPSSLDSWLPEER